MSKKPKKDEAAAQPAQPPEPEQAAQPKPDALTIMATQLEEMRAEFKKTSTTLAEAIVKINEKVEAKAAAGGGGGGDAVAQMLNTILAGQQGTSIDAFAKQADSFAKAADALERFRHPSRIGIGEALLMRLGMRAAFPRYMTKAELARVERAMGVVGAFEEEEAGGHVSE